MANRFINDDVKLRHGGRKAPRMSAVDLRDIIIRTAMRLDDECFQTARKRTDELELAARIIVDRDTSMASDNKFNFEFDNFYTEINREGPNDLRGLHTLSNGFSFLGFETAGDEQIPGFGIMYYDGKRLRLYFPSYGNNVNLDFKCALGSEEAWDSDKEEKLEKQYRKLGIWDESNEELFYDDDPCWSALYCAKYGLNHYDCFNLKHINWEAIKKDIEARIEV